MKCEGCNKFEAMFILTKDKKIFDEFHELETFNLCEMCLLDHEKFYKSVDVPYKVKAIPERVSFT